MGAVPWPGSLRTRCAGCGAGASGRDGAEGARRGRGRLAAGGTDGRSLLRSAAPGEPGGEWRTPLRGPRVVRVRREAPRDGRGGAGSAAAWGGRGAVGRAAAGDVTAARGRPRPTLPRRPSAGGRRPGSCPRGRSQGGAGQRVVPGAQLWTRCPVSGSLRPWVPGMGNSVASVLPWTWEGTSRTFTAALSRVAGADGTGPISGGMPSGQSFSTALRLGPMPSPWKRLESGEGSPLWCLLWACPWMGPVSLTGLWPLDTQPFLRLRTSPSRAFCGSKEEGGRWGYRGSEEVPRGAGPAPGHPLLSDMKNPDVKSSHRGSVWGGQPAAGVGMPRKDSGCVAVTTGSWPQHGSSH